MVISMNNRAMPYVMGALTLIPLGGTIYRLTEIINTGHWTFDFNPQIVDRLPLFLHGIGMALFLVLGAFQFSAKLRARRPALHRRMGRISGLGAILGGLTGIWMTLLHLDISTPLLIGGRLLFGSAMVIFTVLAIRAAMQRRLIDHQNWIIRAYAIALAAGTLPFIFAPMYLILGDVSQLENDVIQVAGWMINLAIAEKFFVKSPISKGTIA